MLYLEESETFTEKFNVKIGSLKHTRESRVSVDVRIAEEGGESVDDEISRLDTLS